MDLKDRGRKNNRGQLRVVVQPQRDPTRIIKTVLKHVRSPPTSPRSPTRPLSPSAAKGRVSPATSLSDIYNDNDDDGSGNVDDDGWGPGDRRRSRRGVAFTDADSGEEKVRSASPRARRKSSIYTAVDPNNLVQAEEVGWLRGRRMSRSATLSPALAAAMVGVGTRRRSVSPGLLPGIEASLSASQPLPQSSASQSPIRRRSSSFLRSRSPSLSRTMPSISEDKPAPPPKLGRYSKELVDRALARMETRAATVTNALQLVAALEGGGTVDGSVVDGDGGDGEYAYGDRGDGVGGGDGETSGRVSPSSTIAKEMSRRASTVAGSTIGGGSTFGGGSTIGGGSTFGGSMYGGSSVYGGAYGGSGTVSGTELALVAPRSIPPQPSSRSVSPTEAGERREGGVDNKEACRPSRRSWTADPSRCPIPPTARSRASRSRSPTSTSSSR